MPVFSDFRTKNSENMVFVSDKKVVIFRNYLIINKLRTPVEIIIR